MLQSAMGDAESEEKADKKSRREAIKTTAAVGGALFAGTSAWYAKQADDEAERANNLAKEAINESEKANSLAKNSNELAKDSIRVAKQPGARIEYLYVTDKPYKPGEEQKPKVKFRNTGNFRNTLAARYSVSGPGNYESIGSKKTSPRRTLDPNAYAKITLNWEVPSDAPTGRYTARVHIWPGDFDGSPFVQENERDAFSIKNPERSR